MVEHTPGPWRIGKTGEAVVSDTPPRGRARIASEVKWYGGSLIAESISLDDMALISAAPELLAACEIALACIDFREHSIAVALIKDAIAKASGKDTSNA